MKKKSVLMLAAAVLLPALVWGGASNQSPSSTASSAATVNPVGQTLIVNTPYTFTLMVDADSTNPYGMLDALQKETNVKPTLQADVYAAQVERYGIVMSTGQYADAIGGWILGDNNILTMAAEGTIIPLEDLIEKYTVNIKEALAIPNVRASMTLPDGHIYSPPYVVGEPTVTFSPWINQNWLDQLGLKMPTTTDELKQVLIAFRDKIAPVNGQKIIPFSGDPVNMDLGAYAGWFGQIASRTSVNAGYFDVINGTVAFTATRPEYKTMIKYFADLYKEGLIDQELFTQDQTMWKAKGKQGLYGVSIAYGAGDFVPDVDPALTTAHPDINYNGFNALPVLKGPGVTTPMFRRNGYGVTLFRTQFVITDKAQNPAAIIRWLDAVYDPIHSTEADWGPVNTKFTMVSPTSFRAVNIDNWTEEQKKPYNWGVYWPSSLPKFRRTEWVELPAEGKPVAYSEQKVRDALYDQYLDADMMPQVWLSGAAASRVADLQTAISDYVVQKQAEWISGQANVDTEWDAYVAQLNRLGLAELLKLKTDAVNATK
jgi:putative aldouronate transport system substrate-binding protein